MTCTYAIADLHGRHDLFMAAMTRIAEHAAGQCYTLVLLGDYIDRGPMSREILDVLMAPAPRNCLRVCLTGNHEQMMVSGLEAKFAKGDIRHLSFWLKNGGIETLSSFGYNLTRPLTSDVVPKCYVSWMKALKPFYEDAHRIYVHAGLDHSRSLADQEPFVMLWKRYGIYDRDRDYFGKYVVHGHHPNPNGPMKYAHRLALDTLAVKTGILHIAVFDDQRSGPPIEILKVVATGSSEARPLAATRDDPTLHPQLDGEERIGTADR